MRVLVCARVCCGARPAVCNLPAFWWGRGGWAGERATEAEASSSSSRSLQRGQRREARGHRVSTGGERSMQMTQALTLLALPPRPQCAPRPRPVPHRARPERRGRETAGPAQTLPRRQAQISATTACTIKQGHIQVDYLFLYPVFLEWCGLHHAWLRYSDRRKPLRFARCLGSVPSGSLVLLRAAAAYSAL
jgi:hypothetical protein